MAIDLMVLNISGLIFGLIGAVILVWSVLIKKNIDFLAEATYHNETVWSEKEHLQLNPKVLESQINQRYSSIVGLYFFTIGFVMQLLGQLKIEFFINFYFLLFIISVLIIIFVIIYFRKKKFMKSCICDCLNKKCLSLGDTEIQALCKKYFKLKLEKENILKAIESKC